MSHTKVEARTTAMIENARNHSVASGALVTVVSEVVDTVDTRVKHKLEPTDHYKTEAFPTKPECVKVKEKVQIRGFYVVTTSNGSVPSFGPHTVDKHNVYYLQYIVESERYLIPRPW